MDSGFTGDPASLACNDMNLHFDMANMYLVDYELIRYHFIVHRFNDGTNNTHTQLRLVVNMQPGVKVPTSTARNAITSLLYGWHIFNLSRRTTAKSLIESSGAHCVHGKGYWVTDGSNLWAHLATALNQAHADIHQKIELNAHKNK